MGKKKGKNNPLPPPPSPTNFEIFVGYIKKYWPLVVALGVIFAIIVNSSKVKDTFRSKEERHENDNFDSGVLKPPSISGLQNGYSISDTAPIIENVPIHDNFPPLNGIYVKDFDKFQFIIVNVGGVLYTIEPKNFYKGINIFYPVFSGCSPPVLTLGVKNNRIYFSVEILDLKNENSICSINYNRWKVYLPNELHYKYDDEKLEIVDLQNNVAFSINYDHHILKESKYIALINIVGYFVGAHSVLVISNEHHTSVTKNFKCFPKTTNNWKDSCTSMIKGITPLF